MADQKVFEKLARICRLVGVGSGMVFSVVNEGASESLLAEPAGKDYP